MKTVLAVSLCIVCISSVVRADTFGTGANQFTIDFVDISGDASSANGTNIGEDAQYGGTTFTDPGNYRMGKFEITNDQWNKFKAAYGTPTGSPSDAYRRDAHWTGTKVPTHEVSWYEAAQFVNWLNTSTNHAPAYKFSGTRGTSNYALQVWQAGDTGYDASNPYRNSNAYYFLPTEDEWVKAAYWNGTNLQTWATLGDVAPTHDGWNFNTGGPWVVGSGSEELNGTFDMMGNMSEWMESPYYSGDYLTSSFRGHRGGAYLFSGVILRSSYRFRYEPHNESGDIGFRVAAIPEPCSLVLVSLGGLVLIRRRR